MKKIDSDSLKLILPLSLASNFFTEKEGSDRHALIHVEFVGTNTIYGGIQVNAAASILLGESDQPIKQNFAESFGSFILVDHKVINENDSSKA
jgi:hypothetical protein